MSKISLINQQQRLSQLFTASGTFNVPANVSTVFLTGCAGAGGGGGVDNVTNTGGGGGGGESVLKKDIAVTPSTGYTITIGAAGAGGTSAPTNGSAGGTTSFGSLLSLAGGGGGTKGISGVDGTAGAAGGSTQSATPGGVQMPGACLLFSGATEPLDGTKAGLDGNGGIGGINQGASDNGENGGPGFLLIEWVK